jgi:hypothetical protein
MESAEVTAKLLVLVPSTEIVAGMHLSPDVQRASPQADKLSANMDGVASRLDIVAPAQDATHCSDPVISLNLLQHLRQGA